ncbi:uncharacterized protein LOC129597543 [Paramacrobiotus metropolitanus]|uniref:uncharacterized protein LOC129597543 n=1 Tax=Paramacrobiotus metropolitanus TaxID=2943436 RepID=UPI002445EF08|nr:uncharacterized protein LOC129597543 [Paramacrobiotus metropolitanus]
MDITETSEEPNKILTTDQTSEHPQREMTESEQTRPEQPPSLKSILKAPTTRRDTTQPRRMSTVQDQTRYNALATKVGNFDDLLAFVDDGLINTSLDTHKQIIQDLARRAAEDPPRYAVQAVYNEFLPCLQKINKHYHRIAVGTAKEHPYLRDCDARLEWAKGYVGQMAELI